MGFLVLFLMCALALIIQHRSYRKIILYEKYSQLYLNVMRIIALLFIGWGIFYLQDLAFILITVLIAMIIWAHPYTTGLSEDSIIYRQNVRGFAGLTPKSQKMKDIKHYEFIEKSKKIKVMFNIQNQFQIHMEFNKEDREKIEQLLLDE